MDGLQGAQQGTSLFVAFVIEHAKRMLRIVTYGLSVYAMYFHIIS